MGSSRLSEVTARSKKLSLHSMIDRGLRPATNKRPGTTLAAAQAKLDLRRLLPRASADDGSLEPVRPALLTRDASDWWGGVLLSGERRLDRAVCVRAAALHSKRGAAGAPSLTATAARFRRRCGRESARRSDAGSPGRCRCRGSPVQGSYVARIRGYRYWYAIRGYSDTPFFQKQGYGDTPIYIKNKNK